MALYAGQWLVWLVLFPHYKIHFRKKSTFIIAQTHTAIFSLLWATVMSGLCSEHVLPSHLQHSWHHHQTFMREVERPWKTVWTQGYKMSSQRLMGLICMHPKLLMFMGDAGQEVDWSELSAAKRHVSIERNSINLTGLSTNPIPKNWGLYKPVVQQCLNKKKKIACND